MQKTWTYTNYEIKEGLKPGSSQFRYFFAGNSESGEKKCNYCVWIVDDASYRFLIHPKILTQLSRLK